jgi:orotate phosphoribosyltransferase
MEGERPKARLQFGRHDIRSGDQVVIVEDVCNNFSTTAQLIREIRTAGGTVIGIACFLNRSTDVRTKFLEDSIAYPVFAVWDEPIPQYKQDDPFVASDIAAKNVAWRPKHEFGRLQEAMQKAEAAA